MAILDKFRRNEHASGPYADNEDGYTSSSEPSVIHDGDLAFTRVKGGNGSGATYQEAVGAPVESNSPLGYHVGWLTIIFLNVNQMIGTGIFSTRKYTTNFYFVFVNLTINSRQHPQSNRVCRLVSRVLDHWLHHGCCWVWYIP